MNEQSKKLRAQFEQEVIQIQKEICNTLWALSNGLYHVRSFPDIDGKYQDTVKDILSDITNSCFVLEQRASIAHETFDKFLEEEAAIDTGTLEVVKLGD